MVTSYQHQGRCPCCGKSTAGHWRDKALAEMDRSDLLDVIATLQSQFDQVSDQFLRLAQLNQRILDNDRVASERK